MTISEITNFGTKPKHILYIRCFGEAFIKEALNQNPDDNWIEEIKNCLKIQLFDMAILYQPDDEIYPFFVIRKDDK